MRLHRIRLDNFRQHEGTEIVFGPGLTGIIGPNGSGKSTLLEAIAWAIYGNPAARGRADSIRFLRARARSGVRVEVDFSLGRHEYRVWRTLRDAELLQDGRAVANSLTAVTQQLTRLLGMSRTEFFNTYFTGQKELAVMAAMGPTERGQFLSRLLGYERLRVAQERLRERRSALRGELVGVEAGLGDAEALAAEREAVEAALAETQGVVRQAAARRDAARVEFGRREPTWHAMQERRERVLSLGGERRIAEQAVKVAQTEFQRLDRELAQALRAREECATLESQLAPLPALRVELDTLETAARGEGERREWRAQLGELERRLRVLDQRLTETAASADELARAETALSETRIALDAATRAVAERRTEWVRDRQDADTKRQSLRDQYRDAKDQRDLIERLGPDGVCPTCQRPLGTHHGEVLALLERQLEQIEMNGRFFKQRVEQLEAEPQELVDAEREREQVEAELRTATERAATLRAVVREREAMHGERETAGQRARELEQRLAREAAPYDAERHDAVRQEVRGLEPVAARASQLMERASRAEELVREAERAERELSEREQQVRELTDAVRALGFDEAAYAAERERYEVALGELNAAEVALAEARGRLTAAEQSRVQVERREAEQQRRLARVAELRGAVRLHNELDRALGDLRTDLNAQVRPELSEVASAFLADLTDGRYDELILDEDYRVTILEEGIPKPVISGGEEDVANLVLRLAISQLVAERAGQPLSLLVLDEIFGSLDEPRRHNVVELLRRLRDRFAQVILITHVESVREGLDRIIRVTYDPVVGASRVRDETALPGEVGDEDVAA